MVSYSLTIGATETTTRALRRFALLLNDTVVSGSNNSATLTVTIDTDDTRLNVAVFGVEDASDLIVRVATVTIAKIGN